MVRGKEYITPDKVMEWLGTIPDPDIPVISITELGLVREVKVGANAQVEVTLTPSYSGCPAMSVFKDDIIQLLKSKGIEDIQLKISYNPAWTTDWLSESTKEKMRKHGIAPPVGSSNDPTFLFKESDRKVACPYCGDIHTTLTSQFGSTPCKALWYCHSCQQPFEYFKCL